MKIAQAKAFAARLDSLRRVVANIHIVLRDIERLDSRPGKVAQVDALADAGN